MMKGRIATMMVALIAIALVVTLDCSKEEAKQDFIAYESLRRWTIPAGGVGMEILVSEEATKEEVLTLAYHLRAKYLSEGFIVIRVFDSKEAYLRKCRDDDPNYPHEKYMKHFLVDLVRNPKTGYDRINWVAEGRDH
jgi:hypothetical protein